MILFAEKEKIYKKKWVNSAEKDGEGRNRIYELGDKTNDITRRGEELFWDKTKTTIPGPNGTNSVWNNLVFGVGIYVDRDGWTNGHD